jgi:hypothetical protein
MAFIGTLLICCCAEDALPPEDPGAEEQQWTSVAEIHVEVTADNFCSEVARVTCSAMHDCCSASSNWDSWTAYSHSENECRYYKELDCLAAFSSEVIGMEGDTVTLDVALATKCLEELLHPGQPCLRAGKAEDLVPSCKLKLFVGKQTEGKACLDDVVCADGLFCGPDFVCSPPPAVGDLCAVWSPEPCAPGLFCGAEGVCQKELKKGEECPAGLGCGQGLFCGDAKEGKPGVCTPLAKLGEKCQADFQCTSSLCQPGKCLSQWGWGGECFLESDCATGVCAYSGMECRDFQDRRGGIPCPGACGDGQECTEDSDCKEGSGPCVQEECVIACAGGRVCADRRDMLSYCEAAMDFGGYPSEYRWGAWW